MKLFLYKQLLKLKYKLYLFSKSRLSKKEQSIKKLISKVVILDKKEDEKLKQFKI